MHCNRHVVKMILETTQLLWTAVHASGIPMDAFDVQPYRKTHEWHPTAIWVRQSAKNWRFAVDFGLELCKEYTRRYKKVHKCEKHLHLIKRIGYQPPLETRKIKSICGPMKNECTPFPLAMPTECVVYKNGVPNAVRSYRKYYKVKNDEWTKKGRPMKFM